MTAVLLLEHVLAFIAPAVGVALVLALGLRLRRAGRFGRGTQLAVLVLLAGLIAFGRDGRVATYAALVLVQGSLAWWLRGR